MAERYRPEPLLVHNEATMDNFMDGPVVSIRRDCRMVHGTVTASFNWEGFKKYRHLLDEYRCTGLSIQCEKIATDPPFRCDLRLDDCPGLKRVDYLHLSGSTGFPKDFDVRGSLAKLSGIKALVSDMFSYGTDVATLFPGLRTWFNCFWRRNPLTRDGPGLPALRNISIQNFSGDVSVFGASDLHNLFLHGATMPSLDGVAAFRSLRRLYLSGPRRPLDVSVLGRLPALDILGVVGSRAQPGWDEFCSDTVETLRVERVRSRDFLANLPRLKNFDLIHVAEEKNRRVSNIDIATFDDPFCTVHELRKVDLAGDPLP